MAATTYGPPSSPAWADVGQPAGYYAPQQHLQQMPPPHHQQQQQVADSISLSQQVRVASGYVSTRTGSYVPPPIASSSSTAMSQGGNYVTSGCHPASAAGCGTAIAGTYVQGPPAAGYIPHHGAPSGSYVPPVVNNSYVPPAANGSYVPQPVNGSYVPPPAHSGSYVPPPVVAASGSYVQPAGCLPAASPQLEVVGQMSSVLSPAPISPLALLGQQGIQGLPDPELIEQQKIGYMKLLDEQLKQGVASLDSQRKEQTEYLCKQADQQKKQVDVQISQQVKEQEMQLMQHFNQEVLQLQQHIAHQKVVLDRQAMQLKMEFKQRKGREEMLAMQFKLQQEHVEAMQKALT